MRRASFFFLLLAGCDAGDVLWPCGFGPCADTEGPDEVATVVQPGDTICDILAQAGWHCAGPAYGAPVASFYGDALPDDGQVSGEFEYGPYGAFGFFKWLPPEATAETLGWILPESTGLADAEVWVPASIEGSHPGVSTHSVLWTIARGTCPDLSWLYADYDMVPIAQWPTGDALICAGVWPVPLVAGAKGEHMRFDDANILAVVMGSCTATKVGGGWNENKIVEGEGWRACSYGGLYGVTDTPPPPPAGLDSTGD